MKALDIAQAGKSATAWSEETADTWSALRASAAALTDSELALAIDSHEGFAEAAVLTREALQRWRAVTALAARQRSVDAAVEALADWMKTHRAKAVLPHPPPPHPPPSAVEMSRLQLIERAARSLMQHLHAQGDGVLGADRQFFDALQDALERTEAGR